MLLTPYMLNMIVHSIMYSYYFSSIFIKDLDKIMNIKKSITIMQMVSLAYVFCGRINKLVCTVNCTLHHYAKRLKQFSFLFYFQVQFTLILFNCVRALITDCGIETIFFYIFVPNILIIFYEFYEFYKRAYLKRGKGKASPVQKGKKAS